MKKLLLFIFVLLFSFNLTSALAEKGYGFQVVNVTYPQNVRPNENFLIYVTIHYWIGPYFRDKIQLQVRVHDIDKDATILIQNYPYEEYNVSGEDFYTLTLTAPGHIGLWHLSVRAYLVATHYDLSHAETDWYKDVEIQVSETAISTTATTYSTIGETSSTSTEITYESTTQFTTIQSSLTDIVSLPSVMNTYVLVASVAVAAVVLAIVFSRSRRKDSARTPIGKYCVQCGIQLEGNAKFCNRCGTRQ
jgi:zinc-ribbon domain